MGARTSAADRRAARRILVDNGWVHRLDLQRILGETWGLPFIDLLRTDLDEQLAQRCDPDRLLNEGWFPVELQGDRLLIACCEGPSGSLLDSIHETFGEKLVVELRTTTPLDVERAVMTAFRGDVIDRSTEELRTRRPKQSAATGLSLAQRAALVALGLAVVALLVLSWRSAVSLLVIVAGVAFLSAIGFKLVCVIAGLTTRAIIDVEPADGHDRDLPIYTVLVPVYREANVIGGLIENLAALDYPMEKLEVLVLLEADDTRRSPPPERLSRPRRSGWWSYPTPSRRPSRRRATSDCSWPVATCS